MAHVSKDSATLLPNSLRGKICRIVAQRTGVEPQMNDTFASLGVDSLAMAEIMCEIENACGFRADESLLDIESIGELCEYVEDRAGNDAE